MEFQLAPKYPTIHLHCESQREARIKQLTHRDFPHVQSLLQISDESPIPICQLLCIRLQIVCHSQLQSQTRHPSHGNFDTAQYSGAHCHVAGVDYPKLNNCWLHSPASLVENQTMK